MRKVRKGVPKLFVFLSIKFQFATSSLYKFVKHLTSFYLVGVKYTPSTNLQCQRHIILV